LIGLLKDSGSDSCKELGKTIGDVEVAWINADSSEAGNFFADTAISKDENFKKCKDRGEDEEKCKTEEELETPEASYAQKYKNIPFPICMALRPCDSKNVVFKESTFGIHFGGDGIPIFKVATVDFNLIELAFSSHGDLTTASFDDDLPPLLDVVKHTSWGMHIYLKAGAKIPLCKSGDKELLTAEANAGLGVLSITKLKNGKEIRSAAEFFGYFIDTGADINQLGQKFRQLGSDIKSVNFEINGVLDGTISVNLNDIFGTDGLNDISVDVKSRSVTQITFEKGNTKLDFWNSFSAETSLRDILAVAPTLADCVPGADLSLLSQIYTSVPESGPIDFIGAFTTTLQLDCGPIRVILKVWEDLVAWIEKNNIHSNCKPLYDKIDAVNKFLANVCDEGLKLGFQIRVKNGLVPHDTFIQYNENKLRLSDLPICDAENFGIKPSPHAREKAHDHAESRCDTNDACFSNDGAYKVGFYDGNRGYCLNHPKLMTVKGCLGRCIKKLPAGAACDKDALNIFALEAANIADAEHEACQSGQCTCGVCTDKKQKVPNGGHCVLNEDCATGWCEATSSIGCTGVCRPKRKTGTPAFRNALKVYLDDSCESGKEQCGTCSANYADLANGKYCSKYNQCASRWCEGTVVAGCKGKCQARRRNGQSAWRGYSGSCLSGKVQCGTCTSNYQDLANGKACSSYKQCASRWCEGDVVAGCRGKCQARRANGVAAWKGWTGSCLSGKVQCGTCTSGSRGLPRGKACSANANCRSGKCSCGSSWFCVSAGCRGKCT